MPLKTDKANLLPLFPVYKVVIHIWLQPMSQIELFNRSQGV